MRLNYLLAIPAGIYALIGLGLLFAPDELLAAIGAAASPAGSWMAQALGAAFLGFAWLNWMHRYTKTRGILGRPVLLPNLMFVTVSFWLALGAWRRAPNSFLLACALGFGVLTIAFGARMFGRGAPAVEADPAAPPRPAA